MDSLLRRLHELERKTLISLKKKPEQTLDELAKNAGLKLDAVQRAILWLRSKKLIIVGCGLRPEDAFLWLILAHFLRQEQWQDRRIIIMDINANDIASKVKNYWGVDIERCVVQIEGRIENLLEELVTAINN